MASDLLPRAHGRARAGRQERLLIELEIKPPDDRIAAPAAQHRQLEPHLTIGRAAVVTERRRMVEVEVERLSWSGEAHVAERV